MGVALKGAYLPDKALRRKEREIPKRYFTPLRLHG